MDTALLASAAPREPQPSVGGDSEAQQVTRSGDIDHRTLREAKAGDTAAVERFIRHYQVPVFAFLSRATGHGSHVEDLAQEVFLRVCRALPQFVLREAKISTWIFQIAVRLVQDRRKRVQPILVAVSEDLGDRRSSPEEQCATRQDLGRVGRLAAALPEEQKMALVLVEFHGLSHAEVSEVMDCGVATVKTRIHRARRFLREALAREEGEL